MAEDNKDAAIPSGENGEGAEAAIPEVNQCPACHSDIDIAGLSPFSKVVCPHCDEAVRVRTCLGNYQIKRLLGEGGMSQVFLADDLALDRQVALKILHQELTRDAALMALFEREAKLTASINHPNVVKVYTVGSDSGYFFIAMELVDSFSMEERITQDGMFNEREALDLLHDIAAGLRTAFQGGLIHRDIKPGNILLTQSGNGKLVDFGLAVQQGGEDEVEDLWATPFYVPPEKLEGQQDDFRGDIYSLGATFFHALAGHPPFDANTASLEELREIKSQPISLRDVGAQVSAATIRLIDEMMAYDPDGRPKSYDQLLSAIESVQSDLPGGAASRARRNSAMADSKQGLSLPAWIGIGGGSLAIVGLVITMILGNGSNGGDLPDDLLGGGEDRVLTAGEKAVAARYNEARKQMFDGRSSLAANAFEDLLKTGDLKQPTLGWTHFNAGLAALLNGSSPPDVRDRFSEMARAEGFPDTEKGKNDPEAAFFRKAGREMIDPLPVMPGTEAAFDVDSLESIGLLAYGLKNWNHGEFESAVIFLDAFAASKTPEGFSWMAAYRGLVEPYREDAARLKNLPKPSIAMEEAKLGAMKGELEKAVTEFQTKGGAKKVAQRRLARIDDILKAKAALAAAPPEPAPATSGSSSTQMAASNGGDGSSTPKLPVDIPKPSDPDAASQIEWTPEAEAERDRFVEALGPLAESTASYQFSAAKVLVAGFTAETAAVKQLQDDYLAGLDRAGEFKDRLIAQLASGDYEGKLIRKQGQPIDCKVVGADPEKLVVDLMFGPNDLSWSEVSPNWMLAVAQEQWLSASPGEINASDWEQAVWFARQTGMIDDAGKLADTLVPLSDDFAARWMRLKPLP